MARGSTVVKKLMAQFQLDTTEFKKQSQEIKEGLSRTGAEVRALRESLKLEWDNTKYMQAMSAAAERTELAGKKVELLRGEIGRIKEAIASIDETNEAWEALNFRLKETEKNLIIAETSAQLTKKEMEELSELSLEHLRKEIEETGKKAEKLSKEFEAAGDNLENIGKKASMASAALTAGFAFSIKSAVDIQDAMAGVSKTTGLAGDDLLEMRDNIIGLSKEIPVAAKELAGMAETAGQLGIANENILAFSRTMAEIATVTNLSGEQAAQSFAKFANITQMAQSDVDRLGSSVFKLDANMATTASSITEMMMRLAAAGTQAGMSEAEIAGLAASLSSVGLEAQAGGTAFSKAINQITIAVETGSDKLNDFAKVAGMGAEEFKRAWQVDAAGTLVEFIKGLGDIDRMGQSTIVTLDELGLTEVRMSDALRRAAGSGDLFTNALKMSSEAWADGNVLADAAAIKYETAASKMQLAKNELTALGIQLGDRFLPMLTTVMQNVGKLAGFIADLDESTGGLVTRVGLAVAIFGPLTTIIGKFTSGISSAASMVNKYAVALGTGATQMQAFNVATAASGGPVGFLITGIGLVVSGILSWVASNKLLGSSADDTTEKLKEQTKALKAVEETHKERVSAIEAEAGASLLLLERLKALTNEEVKSEAQKKELEFLVRELNKANDGLNLSYDEQTYALNMTTRAIEDFIAVKKQQIMLQAQEKYAIETAEAIKKAEDELNDSLIEQKDLREKLIEAANKQTGFGLSREFSTLNTKSINLSQAIIDMQENIEKLYEKFERQTTALGEAAAETENNSNAVDKQTESLESLNKKLNDTVKEYESLTSILDRVSKGQDISLSQIIKLVDEYPELAMAIQKTKDGYIIQEEAIRAVAQAKMDEIIAVRTANIAILESERDAAKARLDTYTANAQIYYAYITMARNELKDIEANIASVKSTLAIFADLRAQLDQPWTPSGGGGRSTAASADSAVSAAREEKDAVRDIEKERLEEYKQHLADIRFERDMANKEDAEAQARYFDELRRLRDEYLEENTAEWRSATLELKRYAERDVEAVRDIEKERFEEYKKNLADIRFERDLANKDDIEAQKRYFNELFRLREEYLEANTAEWRSVTLELINYAEKMYAAEIKALEDAANEKERLAAAADEERQTAYRNALSAIQYARDMDVIGAEEYYRRLRQIQQEYLEAYSDEWKRVNVEIYQYEKKLEEQAKAELEKEYNKIERELQEHYNTMSREAQEAYTRRAKQIRDELGLEKDRLNQLIKNIDDELAARGRLKEEDTYEKRRAALLQQIEFERDAENRIKLEKELLRLETEREEVLYRQRKEDEKTALRDQISAEDALAEQQIAAAEQSRDVLLKQYEELYNVMLEQLTGKSSYSPLSAVQQAYESAARQIENTMVSQVYYNQQQYSAPITIANAWTPKMIEALVRNVMEGMILR